MISRFGTIGLVAVVGGALVFAASQAQVHSNGSGSADLRKRQEDAFRSGGYRAAAAITGSYQRTQPTITSKGPATVEQLVRSAEVILVGRPTANQGVLAPSGDQIRTQYRIQVLEVIKGQELLTSKDETVMSVLGGRAALGGATWAQLNVRYSEMPMNGHVYLLFLRRLPDGAKEGPRALDKPETEFWPANGPAGVFAMGPDGTELRATDTRRRGGGAAKAHLRSPETFIRAVKTQVRASGRTGT